MFPIHYVWEENVTMPVVVEGGGIAYGRTAVKYVMQRVWFTTDFRE